jgi:hypothetical protein
VRRLTGWRAAGYALADPGRAARPRGTGGRLAAALPAGTSGVPGRCRPPRDDGEEITITSADGLIDGRLLPPDLPYPLAVLGDPAQVWLAADAPPGILDRLRAAGLALGVPTDVAGRRWLLERQGRTAWGCLAVLAVLAVLTALTVVAAAAGGPGGTGRSGRTRSGVGRWAAAGRAAEAGVGGGVPD